MQVNLSRDELTLIETALQIWEQEPVASGFTSMMLSTIFSKDKDAARRESDKLRQEATDEQNRRKRVVLLLRAKLVQAEARASEHEIETPA